MGMLYTGLSPNLLCMIKYITFNLVTQIGYYPHGSNSSVSLSKVIRILHVPNAMQQMCNNAQLRTDTLSPPLFAGIQFSEFSE